MDNARRDMPNNPQSTLDHAPVDIHVEESHARDAAPAIDQAVAPGRDAVPVINQAAAIGQAAESRESAWFLTSPDGSASVRLRDGLHLGVNSAGEARFGAEGTQAAVRFHRRREKLVVTRVRGRVFLGARRLVFARSIDADSTLTLGRRSLFQVSTVPDAANAMPMRKPAGWRANRESFAPPRRTRHKLVFASATALATVACLAIGMNNAQQAADKLTSAGEFRQDIRSTALSHELAASNQDQLGQAKAAVNVSTMETVEPSAAAATSSPAAGTTAGTATPTPPADQVRASSPAVAPQRSREVAQEPELKAPLIDSGPSDPPTVAPPLVTTTPETSVPYGWMQPDIARGAGEPKTSRPASVPAALVNDRGQRTSPDRRRGSPAGGRSSSPRVAESAATSPMRSDAPAQTPSTTSGPGEPRLASTAIADKMDTSALLLQAQLSLAEGNGNHALALLETALQHEPDNLALASLRQTVTAILQEVELRRADDYAIGRPAG